MEALKKKREKCFSFQNCVMRLILLSLKKKNKIESIIADSIW